MRGCHCLVSALNIQISTRMILEDPGSKQPGTSGAGKQTSSSGGMDQRSRLDLLMQLLGFPMDSAGDLQESEASVKDLFDNSDMADAIISRIVAPHSGQGSDELCQWFYESYQSGDADLQALVLQFIPTLCAVYFARACGDIDEPLAGFEAVLLALYTNEAKVREGRPALIHLPSLSQASLYHTPPPMSRTSAGQLNHHNEVLLNAPLEPQTAVKSTKRATIVGLALDLFWRKIATMPLKSKLEFCQHARRWAILGCSWGAQVDEIAKLARLPSEPVGPPVGVEHMPELGHALATGEPFTVSQAVSEQPPQQRTLESGKSTLIDRTSSDAITSSVGSLSFNSATSVVEDLEEYDVGELGVKLPLSLDLLRPIFKILGHCLMSTVSTTDLKEAASSAARALYVRASEDLIPEAILASRSLVRLGSPLAAQARTADGSLTVNGSRSISTNSRRPEVSVQS